MYDGIQFFGHRERLQFLFVRTVLLVIYSSLVLAGCSHGRALKQGNLLYSRGEYVQSLEAYEEALAAKPDSDEAAAGAAASRRQIVRGLIEEGKTALDKDEVTVALDYFERASDLPGSYPDLQRFRDNLIQRTVEHAESEISHSNYANALFIYDRFRSSSVGDRYDFDTRYEDLAQTWAAQLHRLGLDVSGEGWQAYALLLFAKAAELSRDSYYRVERGRIWQEVRPTLLYTVRIDRDTDGTAGAWTEPALVSGDSDIVQILVGSSGKPANATVLVDVLSPTIRHHESTHVEEVEYQSDTRDLSNPEYERLERRLNLAERRLMDSEREVTTRQANVSRLQLALEKARERGKGESDSTTRQALRDLEYGHNELERAYKDVQNRRDDVQGARRALNHTSKTVQEPVYSIYRYPIITHVSYGSIDVEYVINHADGRSAIQYSKRLELEVRDHEYEAHLTIGLASKYLDMPADSVLEERLMRLAADKIMEGIRDSFDGYRASVLKRAMETTETGERIDGLIRYLLLSNRSKYPDLDRLIYEVVGIPDTQSVLSPLNR